MNNLFTLVKTNLRETLDKRKFRQNKKQQAFFVYILLMGILFVGISVMYSFIYGIQYVLADKKDQLQNLSICFFVLATFMVFTSTISKMQSIFVGNDYDILASLPITKKDIVLSKIFNLYIIELLVCLIMIVPNSIILTILSGNLLFLLLLPLAFVAPAFPMLVALFITAIIELLIKNKKVKTIISTTFTMILLIGVMGYAMYSSFSMSSSEGGSGTIEVFNTIGSIAVYINPSLKFLQMAFDTNGLWILAYVGSNALLLFVVLSIVVLSYSKIHSNMTMSSTNKKHKKNKNGNNRIERTQKKEIAHITHQQFFKSKNAVMQCGMGLIMGIIFAIAAAVGLNYATFDIEGFDLNKFIHDNAYLIAVGLTFFMGMLPPAAAAISIEGKKFFILKTFPMDFKMYLKEKLKFSYMIMAIPSLIVSLILAIFVKQTVFSIVITILFPQFYCFALSAYTLFINATFPYLCWKEEIEVYKYHKSTVITVFGDMGISMFTIISTIILSIISPYAAGAFLILAFFAIGLIFYLILIKKTSKKLLLFEQEE